MSGVYKLSKYVAEFNEEQWFREFISETLHFKCLQNEARKLNHQEVAEEDRRKKLPKNWEAVQRRVEWENKEEEAKKVYRYIYANVFNCTSHTDIKKLLLLVIVDILWSRQWPENEGVIILLAINIYADSSSTIDFF